MLWPRGIQQPVSFQLGSPVSNAILLEEKDPGFANLEFSSLTEQAEV